MVSRARVEHLLTNGCRDRDRAYGRDEPRETSAERRAKIAQWQAQRDKDA